MARFHPLQDYDADAEQAEINLAPMIDILFILLIFFLVSTSFVRESGVTVQRPAAETASAATSGTIMVAITASGEIRVDRQIVDLRRLGKLVSRLHGLSPQAPVIIQADKTIDVGLLVRVMDQVRAAGVVDIAIAAEVR